MYCRYINNMRRKYDVSVTCIGTLAHRRSEILFKCCGTVLPVKCTVM